MFRRYSATFAIFSILLDGVLSGLSLRIATATRPLWNSIPGAAMVPFPPDLPHELYYLLPMVWVAVLLIFSVYDGRRNLRAVDEFSTLTAASGLAAIAMAGILYLTYREISRLLFFAFCLLAFILLVLWRVVARLVFRWRLPGFVKTHRVLVLGVGEGGLRLRKQIVSQPHLGLELVGFLDSPERESAGVGINLLGPVEKVRSIVKKESIDDVVLALPRSEEEKLNWAASELHDLPVRVWVIPDYFSLTLHRSTVEEFAGVSMIDLRAPALTEYQRMVKRAFDLAVTFLSLPFSLLVMGMIAVGVKLDSSGPVFYLAKRAGENGRTFNMVKFRTMVQNADQMRHVVEHLDEEGNLVYKSPNDPRVTRLGRFLRRTSLDELPQLINVFRGEMSLVGPRPELPDLVESYHPWQRKRFAVPQGITGWWQIHGRSDKPMHLHTEEDLYYVQHYSIWLDMQIILQTVWVVLKGKGAY